MLKEILVIDDNPDIRFLVCNILQEQNFNNNIVIPSTNPKYDFCNLINEFCIKKEKQSEFVKINNSLISDTSVKGLNFTIGNFSTIDANVEIGNNVIIGNNVSVSEWPFQFRSGSSLPNKLLSSK